MRTQPTRGPRTESSAGRKVSAQTTAPTTVMAPAAPIEATYVPWKKSRPVRPTATVRPEKTTARPAVATLFAMASSTLPPAASSSRNRLTMNRE